MVVKDLIEKKTKQNKTTTTSGKGLDNTAKAMDHVKIESI